MSLYLNTRTMLVSRTGMFSHTFQIDFYSLHTVLAWVLPDWVMGSFLLSCTYDLLVILPLMGCSNFPLSRGLWQEITQSLWNRFSVSKPGFGLLSFRETQHN